MLHSRRESIGKITEGCRDKERSHLQGWLFPRLLYNDARFSLRGLTRARGFSLAVIVAMGMCIGANSAIYSILYDLVLKPLPFPDADRLVQVSNIHQHASAVWNASSLPQYLDFKAHADLFEGFGIIRLATVTIGEDSVPYRIIGQRISADFFDLLGVSPIIGRFFTPEECTPGHHVVVLAQSTWESRFNSDPNVIGRELRHSGMDYTIIGVAPQSAEAFDPRTQIFLPYETSSWETEPAWRYVPRPTLWARLKPGVSRGAALAQLTAIEQRFIQEVATPEQRAYLSDTGHRLKLGQPEPLRRPLVLLQVGALFVLLIGCINVVNLLLSRANARRPELSIRHALGAGLIPLMRHMIVESLVLTGMATAFGIVLAWAGIQVVNGYLSLILPEAASVTLNLRVLGGALLLALGVGLFMGSAPLTLLWNRGLVTRIRSGARTSSTGRGIRAVSTSLIVGQVAVALILLVGAGLLIRSLAGVLAVRPGFDAAHVIQSRVALNSSYEAPADSIAVRERVLNAALEIPAVEEACVVDSFGVSRTYRSMPFTIRNVTVSAGENKSVAFFLLVSPRFFATMNIPIVEGRPFTDGDDGNHRPSVIVDQAFVDHYFGHRSAVGAQLAIGSSSPGSDDWLPIVGVAARANLQGLENRDGLPFIFYPYKGLATSGFCVLIRTQGPLGAVMGELRGKLHAIDPTLPLYSTQSLQSILDDLLVSRRGIMWIFVAFAMLALVLAATGLYSVLAYDVSQRTREIGIRSAIGASRRQILALVVRQGLWKVGIGVAIGLVGAPLLSHYIRILLFDVGAMDTWVYVVVVFVLLGVAAVASVIPARRALKVDPVVALRTE